MPVVALAAEVARDVGVLLLAQERGGRLLVTRLTQMSSMSSLTQTSPGPGGPTTGRSDANVIVGHAARSRGDRG